LRSWTSGVCVLETTLKCLEGSLELALPILQRSLLSGECSLSTACFVQPRPENDEDDEQRERQECEKH
jgi:hypothetical protein